MDNQWSLDQSGRVEVILIVERLAFWCLKTVLTSLADGLAAAPCRIDLLSRSPGSYG